MKKTHITLSALAAACMLALSGCAAQQNQEVSDLQTQLRAAERAAEQCQQRNEALEQRAVAAEEQADELRRQAADLERRMQRMEQRMSGGKL